MITLFNKFTSGKMQVRKEKRDMFKITHYWKRKNEEGNTKHRYTIQRWISCNAAEMLRNTSFSEVTDTRNGLAVAMSEGYSRIKVFSLKDALMYSYLRDTKFVTLTCLLIGILLWWVDVPTILFNKIVALQSPDLGLIVHVVKDTFLNKVCYEHSVPSPCLCGESLNRTARDLLNTDCFNPLDIDMKRKRAIAFYVASIIIALTLAESVSTSGVLIL